MPDNLDISEVIGKLAENPGLVKDIMNTIGLSQEGADDAPSEKEADYKQSVPVFSGGLPFPAFGGNGKQREALLRALKPYLGEDRRHKVDYIIKVMKLIEMGGLISAVKSDEGE